MGIRNRLVSLRFRIAASYVIGALFVSGTVAAATYGLAFTYLTKQRTDSLVAQSIDGLRIARDFVSRPNVDDASLVTFLGGRGNTEVLVMEGDRTVTSSVSVTTELLPDSLVAAVRGGQVGWTVQKSDVRRLIFGAPVPLTELIVFFVYPLSDVDATLWTLGRILLAVVVTTVAIATVLGARLARATIEPLRRASDAAQQVAEGVLETRLTESRDELGTMATSFNAMTRALQTRIDRERRFVSDASHELRTPLTALKTSVDHLVTHEDKMEEQLRPAARLAAEEVEALKRLVIDLLELTRAESGHEVAEYSDFDLGSFASEVVRRRAPESDVEIDIPDTPVIVSTDKLRLERVVGNLIENAVAHAGVAVRVAVINTTTPRIVVSDSGKGIREEDLPRIFDRFWRGDVSRPRGRSGAGLGLAIARENATIINAKLTVSSELGKGTTFTLEIPQ